MFKNWIVKNILLAIIIIAVFIIGANFLLHVVTQHGKEYKVPDFTNKSVSMAQVEANKLGVRLEVIDSVYVRRMGRGLIYKQNPQAGSLVKNGRRILLTINSIIPKKVKMPNLVGYSMREAKAELIARGLVLGNLIYVNDIATNNVIRQLYHNREIYPGTMIVSGEAVDLVVGLNSEDNQTFIPNVIGMRYRHAVDVIRSNSLNLGRINFARNIKSYADSLDAVVINQTPDGSNLPIIMGSEVSLTLAKKKNDK